MKYTVREISLVDIQKVIEFSDKWLGENHFNKRELRNFLLKGVREDINASFIALDGEKIIGLRLTFAPGEWLHDYEEHEISSHLWHVNKDSVAYLKSLYIDSEYQRQGIGKALSDKSIEAIRAMGAKAIVCHSWVESPGNTSRKYLEKMNFKPVNLYENYWQFKDYICRKCTPSKCGCSACEMIMLV